MSRDQTPIKPESPPLNQRVSFRVSRLHARLNAQAARILARTAEISLSQWRVMVMIESAREISASDIVRQTKFDKALVSRTIKSLVKDGLVEVGVSEKDQRTHLVRFTPLGLVRFEKAWPHMLARQNALAAALSEAEMAQFFTTMSKIEAAIDTQEAP